ncbi:DEAD/DEAH box helicase [Spirulina major CS-329]|uniref:DEAD/DEAH box helicase n=1 Tax=Spirulina TaxID=1154 RepID=UPI00232DE4DC|nr:DEAD/DEAH box helicase [Spirulina major]MDB9502610.1 DEAD/DEAH box helicase [Spirulina major CS-329]
MASDLSPQSTPLQQCYAQLNPVQRAMVQLFAICHTPLNRSTACACWNVAVPTLSFDPPLSPLKAHVFSARISELIDQGMLVQPQNSGIRCPSELQEVVVRDAVKRRTFEPIVNAIHTQLPLRQHYNKKRIFQSEQEWLRELRIAIYREDLTDVDTLFDERRIAYWTPTLTFIDVFRSMLKHPFDPDWMQRLSPEFCHVGLELILTDAAQQCHEVEAVFEWLEELYATQQATPDIVVLYGEQLWLRGYLQEVWELLANTETHPPSYRRLALQGAIAFLDGQTTEAIAHYQASLKLVGKSNAAQMEWFEIPTTVLYLFALLKDGSPAALQLAHEYCTSIERGSAQYWLHHSVQLFSRLLKIQQGQNSLAADVASEFFDYNLPTVGVATLLEVYSLYWLNVPELSQWLTPQLVQAYQRASKADYSWLALELADLIVRLDGAEIYQEVAAGLRETINSQPLIEIVQHRELWELALDALTQLTSPDAPVESDRASHYRLAWRLQFRSLDNWQLNPVEQKLSAKGGWTKGKSIALKRFQSVREMPDYLTEQDRNIAKTLQMEYEYRRYGSGNPRYFFDDQALLALVGHPLVFWADLDNVRVDVVAGEPELFVQRLANERLQIKLAPPLVNDGEVIAVKETPTRLKVLAIHEHHRRIAQLLGENNCLDVPAHAEAKVLQAIAAISTLVTIQSDIGGGVAAEEVPADATPHVHLLPAGEGLKVSLLVRPFADGGSYYKPGQGGTTVIAEIEGKRLQTRRDLSAEKKQATAVKKACPILQQYKAKKGEWIIEEPIDCLALLVQLQALGDRVSIEWPEGEKFRVSRQLGLGDFKFNIRQKNDWFATSGEVQISDSQVLTMQQLMALLDESPGEFVQLSDGQFLALTEEFRKRLEMLKRLAEPKGKDLRINGLAALALDGMVDDVEQLKVDQAWKQHIQHIKAAQRLEPQVPEDLNATLRDYQLDGFTWLARLAAWGVGACLADDMGLGKTLQAIAVILTRCEAGPTLAIAPTSVCMNWISEVEKFAPRLQVKVFGSGDRQQMLDSLEPCDLLVCSYGLLQQDEVAKMLAQIQWETIVLDEAQAIKNQDTKRSQAAMALQGNFKIITTGTPIENHLGELWNLFRFINPGLLGSLESFNQRFAYPIERDQNEDARNTLRRLIQPFILRRTKDTVLKELPSRTEVTLQVELSTEEMAFYEALRRDAIDKLTDSDAPAGQKHLQVLAEIMRLRRACCHPKLVRPELGIPSAKLKQFGETLAELLDNDHKVLVFSQFVDHLTILRDYLDRQNIAYQYLDGSTPAKQRKQRVDAFQDGEGDVFLISLKAGGTGLNLTAADFVIHMDPWWNPAVEDQASDRAHRIGQQRPVTIYRLVAQGTIEDKIVALHQTKRDLADSLLAGADFSGKISTDELLSLIQQ